MQTYATKWTIGLVIVMTLFLSVPPANIFTLISDDTDGNSVRTTIELRELSFLNKRDMQETANRSLWVVVLLATVFLKPRDAHGVKLRTRISNRLPRVLLRVCTIRGPPRIVAV